MTIAGHAMAWWQQWLLVSLALFGVWFLCGMAGAGVREVRDWWRDRVSPLLEDDPVILCGGCKNREHCDGAVDTCDCTCGWDEDWAEQELPPERTWEQMTSHQLPLVGAIIPPTRAKCAYLRSYDCRCDDPAVCPILRSAPGTYPLHLEPARERRPLPYEAEARAHYVAMGFEYPSGLMARVRELAP